MTMPKKDHTARCVTVSVSPHLDDWVRAEVVRRNDAGCAQKYTYSRLINELIFSYAEQAKKGGAK